MRRMRCITQFLLNSGFWCAALLLGLAARPMAATGAPPGNGKAATDPEARAVASALFDALGGTSGFDRARALQFTFTVSLGDTVRSARSHWWDRFDGRYRVQVRARDGRQILVLFNVQSRSGAAWVNGEPQEGDALKEWLDRGYAWFINDSYWLLMPAKILDPGVRSAMDGEARVGDIVCDRVRLTFDHVGLTPGDTYWAYVDRSSHLMLRWGMILEGEEPGATETQYDWLDWRQIGPIRLSTRKVRVDDPSRMTVAFPDLSVAAAFPDSVFTTTSIIHP